MVEKKSDNSIRLKDELDKAAETAVRVIENAAANAARTIAVSAEEAHKVVADAAATSVKVLHLKSADDHDLLIELRTRMEGLKTDIKDIKDGTTKRLTDLENNKVDKSEFNLLCDEIHVSREKRLRALENKTANYWISFTLYSALVLGMITLFVTHMWKV
jgi:hypothetical protein